MTISFSGFVKITSFRYPKAKCSNPSAISAKIFEEKTFLFEIVLFHCLDSKNTIYAHPIYI